MISGRELQVLRLLSEGWPNSEIGYELLISEETVKSHVRSLLSKLQARNRTHVVATALRQGLIA